MTIYFFGLNELAEACLEKLLNSNIEIKGIIVPPEQRTEKLYQQAQIKNISVTKLTGENDAQVMIDALKQAQPDLLVIAGFSKLIPQEVIDIPKWGAINVHTAKLPAYRGMHPINWAIINDEKEVGTTIHYIDQGMDSGDILKQATIPVSQSDTITTLRQKLFALSADLLLQTIHEFETAKERINGTPQDHTQASLAPKRTPENSHIEWNQTSREIFNLIRSTEFPYQAFSHTHNNQKVEMSEPFIDQTPGTVLAKIGERFLISTADGVILVKSSPELEIGEKLS